MRYSPIVRTWEQKAMDDDITVIKLPEPKPLPPGVIACPRCGGTGHNTDGWVSFGTTEIRSQAPSKCPLCRGAKYLKTEPYER